MTIAPATAPAAFGIKVAQIRVADFRLFEEVDLSLEEGTTVLLGENNTGKSTLLAALSVAFNRARVEPDDLHRSPTRTATQLHIDVRFAPTTGDHFSDAAQNVLGDAINLGDLSGTADSFVLRFIAALDGSEIKTRRAFLNGWGSGAAEKLAPLVGNDVLQLLAFDMLDAQRDVVAQLRNRRTTWSDVASLADVPNADRVALEAQLRTLSDAVTDKSAILSRVRADLSELGAALASGPLQVDIDTIPRKLGDLVRSMDITVGAQGALPFGAAAQGMGTRSLAALLVFRSGVNSALLAAEVDRESAARLSAFEEPEAHLHPNAQRSVFATIDAVTGQKIITTHSTHLISTSPTTAFRLLRRAGAAATVSSSAGYLPSDIADVERLFVHRHPDALFAKAVALVEGDSEQVCFKAMADVWWQGRAEAVGVSLISCDGVSNVVYFGPFLELLDIPWVFLRDGDAAGVQAEGALRAKTRLVLGCDENDPDPPIRTIALAGVIEDVFESLGSATCDSVLGGHPEWTLDDYIAHFDGQPKKKNVIRDYKGDEGRVRARRDLLVHDKLATARIFGRHFAGLSPSAWPEPFRALFQQLDVLIGRPARTLQ